MKKFRTLIAFAIVLSCGQLHAQQRDDCSAALVSSSYRYLNSAAKDWRMSSYVSEEEYNALKRNADGNAELFGISVGANYDEYQKNSRKKLGENKQSLSESQYTNVLWTGLDPNGVSAYTDCVKARRFSQRGLHLSVRAATPDEVSVWIAWTPTGLQENPALEWQYGGKGLDRLPRSVLPGDRVITLPRPKQKQILVVNGGGYSDALILEPMPVPLQPDDEIIEWVETTEVYDSPPITGWGTNFSDPYIQCTPDRPGWKIVSVKHYLSSSTRRESCGMWTRCAASGDDSPTRACRAVSVQGHNDGYNGGHGTAVSHLQVKWLRPVRQTR